jgi:hypothetical protein
MFDVVRQPDFGDGRTEHLPDFRFDVHLPAGGIVSGMIDETPRPKRKRRRSLIAGVLLSAVIVSSWWCWPRGDARFIGKWRISAEGVGDLGATLVFRKNGTGYSTGDLGAMSFCWTSTDQELICGNESGRLSAAILPVVEWIGQQTGQVFLVGTEDRYRIESAEPDRINVYLDGSRFVFTRIAE